MCPQYVPGWNNGSPGIVTGKLSDNSGIGVAWQSSSGRSA